MRYGKLLEDILKEGQETILKAGGTGEAVDAFAAQAERAWRYGAGTQVLADGNACERASQVLDRWQADWKAEWAKCQPTTDDTEAE